MKINIFNSYLNIYLLKMIKYTFLNHELIIVLIISRYLLNNKIKF